ncbi:hypothetical protein ACWEMU_14055, partial [Streptomyces rubiginosohelvolus]
VRFDAALEALLVAGHRVFVEASPHPVLTGAVTQYADHLRATGVTATGTLRRNEPEETQLLRGLAEVFVAGVDVDWSPWVAGGRLVELPTYAFQRRRYWQPPAAMAADVGSAGLEALRHPLLGAAVRLAGGDDIVLTGRVSRSTHPWLEDHAVFGTVLLPGTAFVEMALRAPARMTGVWLPDTVGDRRPQNLPGTWDQYPNWRLPIADPEGHPVTLEEITASPRLHALMEVLRPRKPHTAPPGERRP